MLTIIVRSRKDAAAVEAMAERFYPDWNLQIRTLHGARTPDKALEELEDILRRPGYYLLLLGREDEKLARSLAKTLPATATVHVVPRARVRNARLEMLAAEFARARAKLRVSIGWDEVSRAYTISRGRLLHSALERPEPSYEAYLGLGRTSKLIEMLAGVEGLENPLILRTVGDEHLVFSGPKLVARIYMKDGGFQPKAEKVSGEGERVSLERVVEANRPALMEFERASIEFLKSLGDYDTVIVPWSGGKDSTAALLLALKAYGAKRVVAVFGDTGTEFPETVEYVEKVSKLLGVRVERAYAGIDRELRRGRELPSHDNRWCTALKVRAIEEKAAELAEGRTLIVVGDRDAESPRRSMRAPVRSTQYVDHIEVVAPLRLWSALHVQLYILSHGIPLNPLYSLGFYRIGCYMCPALRSWEIAVIVTSNTHLKLLRSDIYRRFIMQRLYRQPRTQP
jgi:3'-phosphoadenosine 5'-phosphosulfate sulfotransferase (PAPS reductase)/FAD synthetase/3'-phosphoadenosine 5'-phosphosulfate sulfotransferase